MSAIQTPPTTLPRSADRMPSRMNPFATTRPVSAAARVARSKLPVVRSGRLVGILTERDVLRAFEEALSTDALTRAYRWAAAYR